MNPRKLKTVIRRWVLFFMIALVLLPLAICYRKIRALERLLSQKA